MLVQIIFGNYHFLFCWLNAPEICQAYIWSLTIYSTGYYLCGSISGNRVMNFILNRLEKQNTPLVGRIIVDNGGINIGDFFIKSLF